jgi:hypothetical protein
MIPVLSLTDMDVLRLDAHGLQRAGESNGDRRDQALRERVRDQPLGDQVLEQLVDVCALEALGRDARHHVAAIDEPPDREAPQHECEGRVAHPWRAKGDERRLSGGMVGGGQCRQGRAEAVARDQERAVMRMRPRPATARRGSGGR